MSGGAQGANLFEKASGLFSPTHMLSLLQKNPWLPAVAAVVAAPFTGGASLAADGALAGGEAAGLGADAALAGGTAATAAGEGGLLDAGFTGAGDLAGGMAASAAPGASAFGAVGAAVPTNGLLGYGAGDAANLGSLGSGSGAAPTGTQVPQTLLQRLQGGANTAAKGLKTFNQIQSLGKLAGIGQPAAMPAMPAQRPMQMAPQSSASIFANLGQQPQVPGGGMSGGSLPQGMTPQMLMALLQQMQQQGAGGYG